MARKRLMHGSSESGSPRAVFATRLQALFAAADNPTLDRVKGAATARMAAARAKNHSGELSAQRISEWRRGDSLPKTFDAVEPVLLTLKDWAIGRSNPIPSELTHMPTWHKLWSDAQTAKGSPRRTPRSDTAQMRPTVTTTLRRDITTFVGRDIELQRILDTAQRSQLVSIHTVDGMPGVGKTALVTRAAHQLADRFPDGRYLVELHAHTPGQQPARPEDVLATLLAGLGVSPRFLPDNLEGRRDLWLDHVSDKRVLLILDDAVDHAQVEPLLPGGNHCLTLITSRRRLIALDGAIPLPLDVLDPEGARDLFTALAHRPITAEDRSAVETIVRLCGFLPLAIVILAGRLAHHPAWTITGLAADFTAATNRLAELGTEQRAVRAAFEMSYKHLPPQRARMFRHLGLHPGLDIDSCAAAALADLPVAVARDELDALYADHLLDETRPGRYQLHDLLRNFAHELAELEPTHPAGNTAAMDRLLDYYQHTATNADRWLRRSTHPTDTGTVQPAEANEPRIQEFGDQTRAWAWMRTERDNLIACLNYTAGRDPVRTVELTGALAGLLDRDGPWAQAAHLRHRALEAAHRLGDRLWEANLLYSLGIVRRLTGDYEQAADLQRQALNVYRDLGDRLGEANTLYNLGIVRRLAGDYKNAADLQRQALNKYRYLGNRPGEANALNDLGIVRRLIGDYEQAGEMQRQALSIYRDLADRLGEANALNDLGIVRRLIGDYEQAGEMQRQALSIYRDLADPRGEADALNDLGIVRRLTGDYMQAADLHQQALDRYRDLGDRTGEAKALNGIGALLLGTGELRAGLGIFADAAKLARAISSQYELARALEGTARCRVALGTVSTAVTELREAIETYRRLAAPEGAAAAAYLATLDPNPPPHQ
ncbi:tetratricopeptide repeat protein [Nocardia vinacea]|uniref:ATP-binding protein n=1 Tax=Nocardia vinacea TaxID=96468 RepID=UPI00340AB2CA